jgi:tetrahydromethanopterin S-methyltransferase subunit G
MSDFLKKQFHEMKDRGEDIGIIFFLLGFLLLVILFILLLLGKRSEIGFVSIVIGLMSFGLGFAAIGISAKTDKRHTELLERLDRNITLLPTLFKNDILTPPGQMLAKEMLGKQSKEAAQKRLDEDTKRVGFVRGEIYQLEDGSWAIHWGGKYPL